MTNRAPDSEETSSQKIVQQMIEEDTRCSPPAHTDTHVMYAHMKIIPEQTFLRRNHVTKMYMKNVQPQEPSGKCTGRHYLVPSGTALRKTKTQELRRI